VKRTTLFIVVLTAACGGGGAGSGKTDTKTASSADDKKKDDVGSIGEIASSQGGISALGGAGNREEGSTGAEVSFSGAFAAHEADKKTPVKIDGTLKEWPARSPAKETVTGKTEGLSLDVGVMYDDAKLYVAAEIVDPKGSRSGKHAESEDHVAMTIAFPAGRGQLKAYDVGFWAGKPGSSVGAVKWLSGPSKGQDIAGTKIVENDQKNGYVFEASIPWASFAEARTMRVGLRAAFRYVSVDGSVKGVLATGGGSSDKPNDLAALPTAPEQAVADGLLKQKNMLGEKPHIDIYADLAGDERKERISVFGKFFTICGPGYRSGHQFFWRDSGAEIVSVEARDVTGRGKEDLVVRKRIEAPNAKHDILEVWALVPGDEPVTLFSQQIAVIAKDGKSKVTNSARISSKEIEIATEPAVGWDAASFKEIVPSDIEPILLPWGAVKSRTYKLEKNKFARASEVAQEPKASGGTAAQAGSETTQPAIAKDQGATKVLPSSDMGRRVLDAYYKDANVPAGTKPKFDMEIQLDGGGQKERILLVGRDIVVLGPAIQGGNGYARISLTQFADEKDITEVTTRDVTGDHGAEILVRGVRKVQPAGGQDRVDVNGLFIYRVAGNTLQRIFSIETGREQGDKRVQGLVQFVPAKGGKGFDIDVRPGAAKGWTEKTYPWPEDKPGSGQIEPLLLPWGKTKSLRYSWNGTQYTVTQ
jgi:hypothetical protein